MPKQLYMKTQQTTLPIKVDVIEKELGGQYVGDFCVENGRDSDGNVIWSEVPVAIFYQPNPDVSKGHSHYFGIHVTSDKRIVITNGERAFVEPIIGVIANDGEVLYSRYRHDYRTSSDGSVFIDGGRDYIRTNGPTIQLDVNGQASLVEAESQILLDNK